MLNVRLSWEKSKILVKKYQIKNSIINVRNVENIKAEEFEKLIRIYVHKNIKTIQTKLMKKKNWMNNNS